MRDAFPTISTKLLDSANCLWGQVCNYPFPGKVHTEGMAYNLYHRIQYGPLSTENNGEYKESKGEMREPSTDAQVLTAPVL